MPEEFQVYYEKAAELLMGYAPKVLLALIVLFVGLKIINVFAKVIRRRMEKTNIDPTLRPFLTNLVSWMLKVMLIISAASMIGIETTSFIAVLGAAGLAIGLALQGTLANFAGGILILIFRPYKVGDLIEAQGKLGVVQEIQIFTTIINTPDSKKVILPNGAVSNGDITNLTALGKRRVDLTIGIAYEANIRMAKDTLLDVMKKHPNVLKDPEPFVGVSELADSSINLAVRPWCTPNDYWTVFFDIQEQGKLALDAAGVTIPFPQMDVHLDKG